ncbi:MAG: hypothetical protein WCA10_05320 [Terracidiphilus sp.]
MKRVIGLALLAVFGCVGCKHTGQVTQASTTLHVTSAVSPCDSGAVEGIFQGKHYSLVPVDHDRLSLAVACFGMISTEDVGKEYKATIEDGYMVLDDPSVKSSEIDGLRNARRKDYEGFGKKFDIPESYLVEHPDKFRYEIKSVSEIEK